MNIDIEARFTSKDILIAGDGKRPIVLCFTHAVKRIIKDNITVEMEIDEFSSDYFMGTRVCDDCHKNLSTDETVLKAIESEIKRKG